MADFDAIWHADATRPSPPHSPYIFAISKMIGGANDHFENSKNHNILAME